MRVACQYFALCIRQAVGTVRHPILGEIPICGKCAARFDLTINPFNNPTVEE